MVKIKFNEAVVSKHVSTNGYRVFIMINHETMQVTKIQQTTASKYSYFNADEVNKVKTFKDVKTVFNQLINRGYTIIVN